MDILNNILGFKLDKEQKECAMCNSKYLLIVAGAGSGKTLTMIGKIIYLINNKNIKPEEILCISFTNATVDSFKEKLKECNINNIDVFTFHKLALTILQKHNNNITLDNNNTLEYIIDEFLHYIILDSNKYMSIVLKYFNIYYTKNIKNKYISLTTTQEFILFKKLISKFIHLFKSHNMNIYNLIKIYKHTKYCIWNKDRYIILIIIIIYLYYSTELNSSKTYDFDDLLIKASNIIDKNSIKLKYKYILIDEFQDTSPIRLNLIKNIIKYNNASLTVVGDDWQSIYRFTGCNLDLFINFDKYFKGASIKKIQNTYRNSQELINIAGNFIMKNKKQIKKQLTSSKHLRYPITIIHYTKPIIDMEKVLDKLYVDHKSPLLILGRNNNDLNLFLGKRFTTTDNYHIKDTLHNDFDIKYLTVHKSKGLECEYVLIINLTDRICGFPNKIKNEKIINYIINDKDNIEYAEERRLFYVALTRTKQEVFLYTPKYPSSAFIQELEKNYHKQIIIKNV